MVALAAAGAVLIVLALVGLVAYLLRLLDRERSRHAEQVLAIVHGAAAERREWAQERSVLLNRIQDPPAGVASSLAVMRPPEPAASSLDVDFER